MEENLKVFGKDEKWLMKKIKEKGYKLDDVFLLICNGNDEVTIYTKDYKIGKGVLE